jgi:DNA-binding NarL/FixJ family response regulator
MKKVVIMDSSTFMQGALKFIVEHSGNKVVGLTDTGMKVLELCANLKPDAVIFELSPREGMDGISIVKELTKLDEKILIIVTFVPGEDDLVGEAKNSGAIGQIAKPFVPKEVTEELGRIFKTK